MLILFCLRISSLSLLFTAFCVIDATAPIFGQDLLVPSAAAPPAGPISPSAEPAPQPPDSTDAPTVSTLPPTPASAPPLSVSTTPPKSSAGDSGVEITAGPGGENTYVGDIATADNNVVVRYRGDVLFADHVIYDRATRIMIATGNVRLFSGSRVYRGDSLTYNLDTKAITSTVFKAADYPRFIAGQQVTTPDFNHYRLTNAIFTTSNREHPSFRFKASTIEYRPNDEVVLKNVLVFVGDVPVFYFPLFVQSLTDSRPTYQFELGDSGQFGYFMDNKYNWVANDKLRGTVEFDLREKRGYAGGVDVQYFPTLTSDMLLKTYFAKDNLYSGTDPAFPNTPAHGDFSNNNVYDGVPSDSRYRVAYQHYLQFGPDFSSTADINVWSDPWITRDYFQSEYQQENQPANFVSLNQYNPNFTISLLASPQANPFFETVERLPEFSVESKQQKIFGLPIEYTSQSSVVNFQRKFADLNDFQFPSDYPYNSFQHEETAYDFYHTNPNYTYNTGQQNKYSAYRYDTYHEIAYPRQYFNFLSLTPRLGGRLTYYSDTNQDLLDTTNNSGVTSPQDLQTDPAHNPKTRLAADVGLSGDFKISRTWTQVSNPNFGINGIRHEIEPFFDAQYAPSPTVSPNEIRGFDNRLYSTQLQPLDWTEYNSIDSIDKQAVVRLGVWNKIQTKRDGVNYDLLTIKTYGDIDLDRNFSAAAPNTAGVPFSPAVGTPGTPGFIPAVQAVSPTSGSNFSDLFNDIHFNPTQQFQFQSLSAIGIEGNAYNEVDNNIIWSPDPSLQFTIGEHYLNHSPIFGDSNQAALQLFYRINEHWQFEGQEQFEATTGRLQLQQYTIYRDLDAWQLAMTYSDSELNNQGNHTIFFSLTLKAFPKYEIHTPRL